MTSAASTETASRTMTFEQLVRGRASAKELAAHLDALPPDERVAEVVAVKGRGLARLWELVEGAAPLSVDEILPASETGTRIYEGRNSLAAFSRFQKRMTRLPDGQVVGYNHQSMSFLTGPGYFLVKPPPEAGPHAGELYFDYTEPPPSIGPGRGEPAGWPTFKPNEAGLSRLVYARMKDYCRRIARGVLIGMAFKDDVSQNAWFTLTYRG
ncbi:MAG TPA: hypothetical protein VHB21_11900 [Minicystis sp.]|nr:hypothetical protein [Minicystis sp.]